MIWPLGIATGAFIGAAVLTVLGGVRLSSTGDRLADRTGLGEALFGGIFFGSIISASGVVMSGVAAVQGNASLAYSNAVGGIAAQTAALAVIDLTYPRVNLEHASASLANMVFCVVLIGMLTLAVMLGYGPQWTLWAVHPGSLLLLAIYVFGYRAASRAQHRPLWIPRRTRETVADEPDEDDGKGSTVRLWVEFLVVGALVAACGWVIATAAASFVEHTGMGATFVGAALMGVVNALPELITGIAAVRRGALTLAVAGVIGGNTFDVLNLVVADVAYRDGSIYGAARSPDVLLSLGAILLVTTLLGGLLVREKKGPMNIGGESLGVLLLYASLLALLAFSGEAPTG